MARFVMEYSMGLLLEYGGGKQAPTILARYALARICGNKSLAITSTIAAKALQLLDVGLQHRTSRLIALIAHNKHHHALSIHSLHNTIQPLAHSMNRIRVRHIIHHHHRMHLCEVPRRHMLKLWITVRIPDLKFHTHTLL